MQELQMGWRQKVKDIIEREKLKCCSKCGCLLPLSEFYAHSGAAGRLQGYCKKCMCDRIRAYNQTHKEEKQAYDRAYRKAHREEKRAYDRAYSQAHPEKWCIYHRAYQTAHPEKIRAKSQRHRARKRAVAYERIDDQLVFEQAGYRCAICGRKTRPGYNQYHPLYPNLDHIIPLARGGPHTWANVQCLCRRCNVRKHTSVEGQQLKLLA